MLFVELMALGALPTLFVWFALSWSAMPTLLVYLDSFFVRCKNMSFKSTVRLIVGDGNGYDR